MRLVTLAALIALALPAYARDGDDHGNHGPLKQWFDGLRSDRGMCCSFADGKTVEPDDVDTDGDHYKVKIDGKWIVVPDEALVKGPNKFGAPVVWPYSDSTGATQIRCFLPGAGI